MIYNSKKKMLTDKFCGHEINVINRFASRVQSVFYELKISCLFSYTLTILYSTSQLHGAIQKKK